MSSSDFLSDDYKSNDESSSAGSNINFRHYWHILLERRWLVIATFIGVFSLGVLYLFKAPKIYRATARLQIDREYDNVFQSSEGLVYDSRQEDYLQTQYRKLKGDKIIAAVRAKLNLDEDERYRDARDINQEIADDIRVNPVRLSRLVDVHVDHTNPETASDIANALTEKFVELNLSFRMKKTYDTVDELEHEAMKLKETWDAKERAVHEYVKGLGVLSIEENQDVLFQGLSTAKQELTMAETQRAVANAAAEQVTGLISGGTNVDSVASLPIVAGDATVAQLKADIASAQATLDQLLTKYKDGWPQVKEMRATLASLRRSLNNRYSELVASIQNEAELANRRVAKLNEVVDEMEEKQIELQSNRIQYDILKRDAETEKALYQSLMTRVKELSVGSASESNNIFIENRASIPYKQVRPDPVIVILLGIFGGMVSGVGLAFFVNYLDDSIKSQDDVETYLRLPFLGYIPTIKSNLQVERDLQSHIHPQSSAAEGFRTLRTTISLMPNYDKLQTISVTSSIPSEGKSLISTNLAIVIAQTGAKTVLVDADLRRPALHKAFSLQTQIGLATYLKGEVDDCAAITHRTEVPNLDIICCGAIPGSPSELAASARMSRLLKELQSRYDRIIVDCPPVSAVSDPLVVASRTDGVVMVTKFNKVRREHAKKTSRRLAEAGVKILGVCLNDIDFEGKDSYYYSYYYYQNRYYTSHYSDEADTETRVGRHAS